MADAKLLAYLDDRSMQLFFCRGDGKCSRPAAQRERAKTHCSDCVAGRDEETLEQLVERIQRGNA